MNFNRKEKTLEDDIIEERKKQISSKFVKSQGLNSEIIDKIMKYCPKSIRYQIMSERIMERHKERHGEKGEE